MSQGVTLPQGVERSHHRRSVRSPEGSASGLRELPRDSASCRCRRGPSRGPVGLRAMARDSVGGRETRSKRHPMGQRVDPRCQ